MKLTCGIYNLSENRFKIEQLAVRETANSYVGIDVPCQFAKTNENIVRHMSPTHYPYLEVYTTDEANPISKVENLISEYFSTLGANVGRRKIVKDLDAEIEQIEQERE